MSISGERCTLAVAATAATTASTLDANRAPDGLHHLLRRHTPLSPAPATHAELLLHKQLVAMDSTIRTAATIFVLSYTRRAPCTPATHAAHERKLVDASSSSPLTTHASFLAATNAVLSCPGATHTVEHILLGKIDARSAAEHHHQ